jgi:multicomponent Na+:H+ antiporter subunit E
VLVVLWLLAWGEASVPNLLTGAVLAAALLVAFPPDSARHQSRIAPLPTIALVAYVARQLITSNIQMTWTILRPRPDLQPGVLAHHLLDPSDWVVTAMTSIIALSPGTMVVDVSRDGATIYVHFVRLRDVDEAHAFLRRLEELVERALPHVQEPTEEPA